MRALVILLLLVTACARSVKPPASAPARAAGVAQDTLNPDGLGFYAPGLGVPPQINAAADSVFLLISMDTPDPSTAAQIDVSEGRGRAFKAQILAGDDDDVGKTVAIKQIEHCEARAKVSEQKSCVVSYRFHQATGFVAGDRRTLWTNAHVVEHSLKKIETVEKISVADQLARRGRVEVYVFSRDGRLLVDPYTDPPRLKVIPPFSREATAESTLYAADSDYVALTLTKNLAPPLVLANQTESSGRFYLLGYPLCTNCPVPAGDTNGPLYFADRAPRPNSDGKSLRVSSGYSLTLADVLKFAGETMESVKLLDHSRLLWTTADSQLGNSGGPVLNERGEVVAIHAGNGAEMIEGRHRNFSRAVIPKEFGH